MMTNYDAYAGIFEMIVVVSALTGETALGLWLLFRGIKVKDIENTSRVSSLTEATAN